MADQLKPCPFCGNEDFSEGVNDINENIADCFTPWYVVTCSACGITGRGARLMEDAIAKWNIRALPPARPAEPTSEPLTANELYALDLCDQYLSLLAAQDVGPEDTVITDALTNRHLELIYNLARRSAAPLPSGEPTSEAVAWQMGNMQPDGEMCWLGEIKNRARAENAVAEHRFDAMRPLYATPSAAPSGWDTDVRLVLSEVATWITLAHHRDGCRQRYGEPCTCGRDSILAKLKFPASPPQDAPVDLSAVEAYHRIEKLAYDLNTVATHPAYNFGDMRESVQNVTAEIVKVSRTAVSGVPAKEHAPSVPVTSPPVLYLGDYMLERCVESSGREYVGVSGSDDVPEALIDDLTDDAALVFEGEVLNVKGWTPEQREAADIQDMECDEYWRGRMRKATPAEVLAVFFGVPAKEAGETTAMRRFTVYRRGDLSATHNDQQAAPPDQPQYEGVVFTDGRVALRWLTPLRSTSCWDSLDDALGVHGHPEPRYGTELVWHDPTTPSPEDRK